MENRRACTVFSLITLFIALGLFFRLAPLARSDLSFAFRPDDSFHYLQLAAGLRASCGFARLVDGFCQKPEILRTPGYPGFLALMSGVRAALGSQAVLGTLACTIIALWLWSYGYRPAALAATFFIAFDVPSIVMASEVMTEILFQFVLVCALIPFFFVRLRTVRPLLAAAAAGIAGGAAILVRPIGLLLPILLPLPFLTTPGVARSKRLAGAAIVFVITVAIPALWSMRNYQVARYQGISTVGAINLYYYRAANAVARDEGVILADTRQTFGNLIGVPYDHIYDADVQSPALVSRMNHLATQILEAHWRAAGAMTLQSAIYLAVTPMRSPLASMLGTSGGSAGDGLNAGAPSVARLRDVLLRTLRSPLLTAAVLIELLLTMLVWIGIAVALVRYRRQPTQYRVWTLYLTLMAVILLVLAAGGEADVRFRAPVAPLLAAAAALGYFPEQSLRVRRAVASRVSRDGGMNRHKNTLGQIGVMSRSASFTGWIFVMSYFTLFTETVQSKELSRVTMRF